MEKLQRQYESFNVSSSAFLSFYGVAHCATIDSEYNFLLRFGRVVNLITKAVYHGKALYNKYQYNQSLEHKVEVEINGVKETVNASPKYFDWYTAYHAFVVSDVVADGVLITFNSISGENALKAVQSALLAGTVLSKLISLKDKYQDFQYTDSKGNIISPEIVESGFIGYIGDSTDNVSEIILDNVLTYTSE